MRFSRPPRASRARSALTTSAPMTAGVWLLASACGPGVATPMPEPPTAFDLSGFTEATIATDYPLDDRVLVIATGTGNVPAGGTVRVTNLDDTSPVVAGPGNGRGGFQVDLIVSDGQELRFEWVKGSEHSAPADAIVSRPDPLSQVFQLRIAPRFACLRLSPGLALDFGAETRATLGVENGCSDAVTFANPRTRLALPDFALPATPPSNVAPGESAQIEVDFTRSTAGLREDVLFLDVTVADQTIRYPITLRTE
jgi:hypothetical protein